MPAQKLPAEGLQLRKTQQLGVAVAPHAPPVVHYHPLHLGQVRLHAEDLVRLLLVLTEHEPGVAEVHQLRQLVRERVLVHAAGHPAQRLGRQGHIVQLGPVVADQGHHVPAPHAQGQQPPRARPHVVQVLPPGDLAPDAELLLPEGHAIPEAFRVVPKALGEGVQGPEGLLQLPRGLHGRAFQDRRLAHALPTTSSASPCSSPRYARMTSGWCWISRGEPSAIFRP